VAFVGGSLVPRGGHSVIEPAQHGIAIVVGQHTENFRDLVDRLKSRNAIRIAGPGELARLLIELLADPAERSRLGMRALEVLAAERGSTERTMERLRPFVRHVAEAKPA
jgi:3-deoxy-D-manno-octulosonic-acid transferase